MATFIVNGQKREIRYRVNGIDISADFIGHTSHDMDADEDGNWITTEENFEWWWSVIKSHIHMDAVIDNYKARFDEDEVDKVVTDWIDTDLDLVPGQVILGLEMSFGTL